MPRDFGYSDTGVDRELRAESKKVLIALRETYNLSKYGKVVQLPYGNVFPIGDRYMDLVIEGVGTKVLLAQLAGKYDTIGIDGVAVAVNDVIRSGARPLAVADNIHEQVSNPALIAEWMKGVIEGAIEADCVVPSGEIGDVAELIKGLTEGKGFDMVFASVGEVAKGSIISGKRIKPGDIIIGMRSSGLHSNGISLARRILFKIWQGKYEPHDIPDGLDRDVVLEALEPTKIYVKPFLKMARELEVKGAVHITGDAYLKFRSLARFSEGIGFIFDNFKPHSIFRLIQRTAPLLGRRITDHEMFKTFNMGWGFAVIVDKADGESAIDVLQKAGIQAEQIGRITGSEGVRILHEGRRMILA